MIYVNSLKCLAFNVNEFQRMLVEIKKLKIVYFFKSKESVEIYFETKEYLIHEMNTFIKFVRAFNKSFMKGEEV